MSTFGVGGAQTRGEGFGRGAGSNGSNATGGVGAIVDEEGGLQVGSGQEDGCHAGVGIEVQGFGSRDVDLVSGV